MLGIDDFAGHWRIERQITDQLAGQQGALQGQAHLTEHSNDRLDYCESGQLRIGDGLVMQAERRYQWRFGADWVDVRFEDGRMFHGFNPTGHAVGTDHPCGDDHYKVRYDFTQWPRWTATWDVVGPRKSYRSTTTYLR